MITRTPNSEADSLELGATFAGYRISVPIGEDSSTGTVYAATALHPEQLPESPPWLPLALKVFNPESEWDAAMERGFVETARLQSTIHHPNLVSIYEVGTYPSPFLSMTLVRGLNLAELIASTRLDDTAALEVTRCVAGALEAAHEHGLVYRDLKPSGVLLPAGEARRAMLGDFGAGRSAEVNSDVESNIRALGGILFECLTCKPVDETGGKLRQFRPDLPAALESVLLTALHDDPSKRQSSPAELLAQVEQVFPHRRRQLRSPAQRERTMAAPAPAPWIKREAVPEDPGAGAAAAATAAAAAGAAAAEAPTQATTEAPAKPAPRKRQAPKDAQPRPKTAPKTQKARTAPKAQKTRTAPKLPRLALLLIPIVALAALLGALLAPDGDHSKAAVSSRSVSFDLPDAWTDAPVNGQTVPGVRLADSVAARPSGNDGQRSGLVAGRIPNGEAGVLPPALAARLGDQPAREPVQLGGVEAYRFRNVRPSGFNRELTVYMVPTTAGQVLVACHAPVNFGDFMLDCERIASTLRLKGASAVSLSAGAAYSLTVKKIVSRLARARDRAGAQLRTASTRSAQGVAAGRLGKAYRSAERTLGRATPPPASRELHAQAAGSLGQAADGYARMARAARARLGAGAWNAGRRQAVRAERQLVVSLQQLEAGGPAATAP